MELPLLQRSNRGRESSACPKRKKPRGVGCNALLYGCQQLLMQVVNQPVAQANRKGQYSSGIPLNHPLGLAVRKPLTSSQCMKASNQRLLVRFGFPRPNP